MSIYITQQQKEEWEAEIADLKSKSINFNAILERQYFLEELLEKAIVLPVEESWDEFYMYTDDLYYTKDYPNGVLIKPKE